MDDDDLLRYSRQIMLPEIGVEGQQRLGRSRALIIGIGGLGSPVAMYLAAAGVGTLDLSDGDEVDISNLQRQILHTTDRIGKPKTRSAEAGLKALNPGTRVVARDDRLNDGALAHAIASADVVLDCSDNFATRFSINALCHASRTALVSGAAIRWEGQVAVFDGRPDSPCYRCLYDESGNDDTSCTNNGVVAPLVGIIGAVQAMEALKLICGVGTSLGGRLLMLDGLQMRWQEMRLRADPQCPVCGP